MASEWDGVGGTPTPVCSVYQFGSLQSREGTLELLATGSALELRFTAKI